MLSHHLRCWISATILLVYFFGMAPISHAEDPAPPVAECRGKDLLAALKANKPQAYERWEAAARKIPNGEAMLWRIDGNGLSEPSWLFGTIHLTDPRILALPSPAQSAFDMARTVVLESRLESRWLDYFNSFFSLPLYYLPDNQTWDLYLTPEEKEFMAFRLQHYGYSLKDFERWRPWAMMFDVLSYPACEYWRVHSGMNYLDAQLAEWAKKAGKRIVGLETRYESARMIADTSLRSQFIAMFSYAKTTGYPEDEQETSIRMYLNRQLHWYLVYEGSPYPLSAEEMSAWRELDYHSIQRRNLVMRERALPAIREGKAFIAVGASHLPGDKGLVELLRKAGYEVTPVN